MRKSFFSPTAIDFFVFAVGLILAVLSIGYLKIDFRQPLMLGGDNIYTMTFAKGYADGVGFRFNGFLGFPEAQDAARFPSFDFSHRMLLFVAAKLTNNPFASYHFLYLIGSMFIYSSCYVCLRKLAINSYLCALGGIIFLVTPFFASRSLSHDFLALYYSVPFGATLALLIGGSQLKTSRDIFLNKFTICACVIVGTSGLYYAFFSCVFILLGGLVGSVAERKLSRAINCILPISAIFTILVFSGYGSALTDVMTRRLPQVSRSPQEQLVYGLNFAESIMAYKYIPGFNLLAEKYISSMSLIQSTKGLFEWPSPLLTTAILLSPVFAFLVPKINPSDKNKAYLNNMSLSFGFITFGLIYSIPGGLGYIFNLIFVPSVRATDRIMPFLMFFAVVIFSTLLQLMFISRSTFKKLAGFVISLALILSVFPDRSSLAKKQEQFLITNAEDIESYKKLLQVKNKFNLSAILQLPHAPWPEYGFIVNFLAYSHQKAYILDASPSQTRWSFGSTIDQPSFKIIESIIKDEPTQCIPNSISKLGFDGILVEKSAYSQEILETVLVALSNSTQKIYDDKFRTLFRVNRDLFKNSGCP